MPNKPLKSCAVSGCPELTRERHCPGHAKKGRVEYGARRNKSWQHLYGARWRRERKAFLVSNPLCAECQLWGRVVAANVVDHVIPHKGDKLMFWDRSNWQGLCKNCHDVKTAGEGAWGRTR